MTKRNWVLTSLSLGIVMLAADAGATLKVVPARSPNDAVLQEALKEGRVAPAARKEERRQAQGQTKSDNFGKTVSKEAKVFRDNPAPGYRNFGQWVSCQRRQSEGKCPGGSPVLPKPRQDAPTPTDVPQVPSAPTGPTAAAVPSGSNGV